MFVYGLNSFVDQLLMLQIQDVSYLHELFLHVLNTAPQWAVYGYRIINSNI